MPTERFYHLPTEKKNLIREAAEEEFSRVSVEKASINKIVQRAGISRGSFYTYFKDKEDVFCYIFEDLIFQSQLFSREKMKEAKGNYWRFMEEFLNYVMDICEKKKIIAQIQMNSGPELIGKILRERCGSQTELLSNLEAWEGELYRMTDCSQMAVDGFEDFQVLFSLCINSMMPIVSATSRGEVPREKGKQTFARKLHYIKYGALRAGSEEAVCG